MAPKTGFDLIELPLESWTIVHADQHRRQFVRDLYGDEFSSRMIVTHQDEPLDGVDLNDLEGIRKLVQNIATQAKQIVVSAEVINAAGLPSLWYILKQSQAPSGMAYSGSLVLPLRSQFFTIQLMCLETGITGIRESIVVDKLLEQGVSFKDLADTNSYCDEGTALAQYSADASIYDERFPQHPLSRVRRYIAEILQCLAGQQLAGLLLCGLLVYWCFLGAPQAVSARSQENILVAQKLNQVEKLIAQAKLEKAMAIIQEVLVADRNSPRAYFLMGMCYQDSSIFAGGEEKAVAAYKKALELDPGYSFPWRKLAELAGYEGRYSEQLRLVNKALVGRPEDKLAYRVRAIAYFNLRQPQEALKDIRKYASVHPVMSRSDCIIKSDIEYSAGAYQDCIKSLDSLLSMRPDGDLTVRKSKALVKLGRSDEAARLLENYLKPHYDYPEALRQLVSVLAEQKNYKDALRYSDILVRIEPTTKAYLQRAAVLDKLGQKAKADQDRKSADNI